MRKMIIALNVIRHRRKNYKMLVEQDFKVISSTSDIWYWIQYIRPIQSRLPRGEQC